MENLAQKLTGVFYFFFDINTGKYFASREYDQDGMEDLGVPFNYTDLKSYYRMTEIEGVELDDKISFSQDLDFLKYQVETIATPKKESLESGFYALDFDKGCVYLV